MGGVKKSVYVFLCSLLGVLMFLVLQRIVVFFYVLLVDYGIVVWNSSYDYMRFVAVDYITLVIMLLCGSWYGIWLGNYWYEQVYELKAWRGSWHHVNHRLFPWRRQNYALREKIEAAKEQLEKDLRQVETLSEEIPSVLEPREPIKRRVVRRKPAVRKPRVVRKVE